jgi:TPR repeat protein
MFELNYSLLDVWNRPEIRILRWGTKKAAQGIASANAKAENEKGMLGEFAELLRKAEAGDSEAQCELAIYYDNYGVHAKFDEWIEKSAKQGNETALAILESLQDG